MPRRAISSTCSPTWPMPCHRSRGEERADKAKVEISTHFNSKQQVFLDFVLSQYVKVGVEELDQDKLTPLLRLKYHDSIADAVADLGKPEDIGKSFPASRSTSISHKPWHEEQMSAPFTQSKTYRFECSTVLWMTK